MVGRAELITEVRTRLAQAGFAVSEQCEVRPISFDVVARRDNLLLIVKILGNVDALSPRVAQELRTLSRFLKGVPLLVGERSSAGPLEGGVLYNHRGIAVLTLPTLTDALLEDQNPLALAAPGGLHVRLRGEILRRLRQERSLSLGVLAQAAGVSRRAIQMYEEGMRATVEAALRLEEYLQTNLVEPLDPFRPFEEEPPKAPIAAAEPSADQLEAEVFRLLRSVGFSVVPTQRSPFDALSHKRDETILTGVDAGEAGLERRAQLLASVTAVAEKDSMIVINRSVLTHNLRGTPLVDRKELQKVRDPAELVRLLDERRKTKPA